MKIIIETTDNGAVIFTDEKEYNVYFSYDLEDFMGADDRKKQAQLLYQLVDLLGWTGSRHDEERIRINVEPGDKFEGVSNEPA